MNRHALNDASRLAEVDRYAADGGSPDAELHRFTFLAARLFGAPMAVLSLVGSERVWFQARVGVDTCEASTERCLCTHVIERDEPFAVLNASADPELKDYPTVADWPFVRFYAGAPLRTSHGHRIGALAVFDTEPRFKFDQDEADALSTLTDIAMEWLEARARLRPDAAA